MPNCFDNGTTTSNFAICVNIDYGAYQSQVSPYIKAEVKKRHAELNKDLEEKFTNGKIKFKAKLVDGRYEGDLIKNYENGNPQERSLYKNGDPIKVEDFFESGAKKSVKLYEKNKIKKRR